MMHFIYGTMTSGKTMDMLKNRRNHIESGLEVLTIGIDDGEVHTYKTIKSRAINSEVYPEILLRKETNIIEEINKFSNVDSIFIDESQFMTISQIRDLRKLSRTNKNIDIYCYGLLTTTDNQMWDSSRELILLSDYKQEIHSRCKKCGSKFATHHLKDTTTAWNDKESYQAVCYECWLENQK